MLIACTNCGAPLDTSGRKEIIKCAYCGVSSRVAAMRTVAQATPADFRPPKEWRAPQGTPGAGAVFTYHRPLGMLISLVGALVTFGIIAAVAVPAFLSFKAQQSIQEGLMSNPDVQQVAGLALKQAKEALENAARKTANAGQPSVQFFAPGGPEQAVAAFKAALKTQKLVLKDLVLYPSYAIAQAQNPTNPKHYDRYVLRDGSVSAGDPISVHSLGADIEQRKIDADKFALAKLPALIEKTVKELNYEQGKVSHVILSSNLPFSKDWVMRVYVSGPRESGRIDYRADGSVLKVYK